MSELWICIQIAGYRIQMLVILIPAVSIWVYLNLLIILQLQSNTSICIHVTILVVLLYFMSNPTMSHHYWSCRSHVKDTDIFTFYQTNHMYCILSVLVCYTNCLRLCMRIFIESKADARTVLRRQVYFLTWAKTLAYAWWPGLHTCQSWCASDCCNILY